MKTPMQQIKEIIENALWDHPNVHELIVNWIDDNMAELMLTEKENIIDAYYEGAKEWYCEYWGYADDYDKEKAERYYNETFNTKE